ncbi:hypothetical protein EDB92DRAFT_1808687 [Lactarius akahatsu]|uniref:Uncharacterized protein n=1 Tax=Lactarius akahatsu TaxID=416441 RepID=A0AAD4Q763_9AGAM|nr:hypothetical protein EDB92DRAFT_1808687 [Lactarius akahatsu]
MLTKVISISRLSSLTNHLNKLCKLAYAMTKPTTVLFPQWYNKLVSCRLPCHMMPRDVSTQWNSMFNMLHFALQYHLAINAMTAMHALDLQKYELSPEEWEIVKELRNVLKDATLFFSCGTPNLATVILAMDHIDKVLTMTSDNSHQFSLPIHAALIIGKC